jgi:hypothetical protein
LAPAKAVDRDAEARQDVATSAPQPPVSPKSRLWTFVNSNFGLWLLSAVLITGVGAGYTAWSQRNQQNAATAATIRRLDLEIGFRFYEILLALQRHAAHQRMREYLRLVRQGIRLGTLPVHLEAASPPLSEEQVKKQLARDLDAIMRQVKNDIFQSPSDRNPAALLRIAPIAEYHTLFPEYSTLPLPALMVLLREQVPPQEQKQIDASLALIPQTHNNELDEDLAIRIKQRLLLPRWESMSSRFRECGPDDPVCAKLDVLRDLRNTTAVNYDSSAHRVCLKGVESDSRWQWCLESE